MVRRKFWLGARFTLLFLLYVAVVLFFSDSCKSNSKVCVKWDLDGDGIAEQYVLTEHMLTITEGSKIIWMSPESYHIDSFALGDVDNDGKDNLVMSLWKKGSFGKFEPFWHGEKNIDYKNHLFVYKLEGNKLKNVWCSSDLDHPILSFSIQDIDGDKLNELVVEEGQYKKISKQKYAADSDGPVRTTVWKWDQWGFYLADSLTTKEQLKD